MTDQQLYETAQKYSAIIAMPADVPVLSMEQCDNFEVYNDEINHMYEHIDEYMKEHHREVDGWQHDILAPRVIGLYNLVWCED